MIMKNSNSNFFFFFLDGITLKILFLYSLWKENERNNRVDEK